MTSQIHHLKHYKKHEIYQYLNYISLNNYLFQLFKIRCKSKESNK